MLPPILIFLDKFTLDIQYFVVEYYHLNEQKIQAVRKNIVVLLPIFLLRSVTKILNFEVDGGAVFLIFHF